MFFFKKTMDFTDPTHHSRIIGDYILGPKIGMGSFAVVWKSMHRSSGLVVAVKEIDRKELNPKVSENLLKEISILSTINHPNIIRLFEAIEVSIISSILLFLFMLRFAFFVFIFCFVFYDVYSCTK